MKSVGRPLVLRFLREVLAQRQLHVVPELFSADVLDHRPAGVVPGIEALTLAIGRFLAAFPDLAITIHGVAVESPVAMAWLTWQGTPATSCGVMRWTTHRPSVSVGSVVVFRLAGGQLTERWEFVDPRAPELACKREHPVAWSQLVPGERPLLRVRW